VPEGDTLRRTADVIGRALVGGEVVAARARPGGAQLARVVGSRIETVRSQGKHLLIDLDCGLTLHTHLGMTGSWHRYRPGERWRRPPDDAVAVIETSSSVAVCFEAPVVELLDSRAVAFHPMLASLGPDLLAEPPDIASAVARLQAPERDSQSIAEALLDQRAVAGLGNVYRCEILFLERIDPFAPVGSLSAETLERLLRAGVRLLRANAAGGPRTTRPRPGGGGPGSMPDGRGERLWVYRRAGRPCLRCGTLIRSTTLGMQPRRLYWCPGCQHRLPEDGSVRVVLQDGRA
jgi:endonuclease-8